ncbi:Haloacid dehalogenase-like hydrolase domain-containing protein Sgpp [Cocos nucifera]|uniref:Haloacid dehalogenase-like hydrolase domain-containing protein Sgpp n=1 Tax=Cocos nucifera TaxID=13894 RepID=A0A8K0IJN0_COCNU|nr:Haloacid dehalogenase-like hydrolase domain-containing protein Sgpp [Cocos nucifera]
MSDLTSYHAAESSISGLAPLEAILFDVDGTLCDSDPMHYHAFREMLLEIGYNNSVPITEEDFIEKIAGKNSEDIARTLFPDWDREKAMKFIDDKEAMFRKLASKQLKAIDGLYKLQKWIEDRGLKHAAVTNAPRPNAELIILTLGLSDFFQHVSTHWCSMLVFLSKPYHSRQSSFTMFVLVKSPNFSYFHSLFLKDSASGIKAGVAAGMTVVGVMTRNPEKSLKDAGASLLIKDYNDPKLWKALKDLERAEATLKKADV